MISRVRKTFSAGTPLILHVGPVTMFALRARMASSATGMLCSVLAFLWTVTPGCSPAEEVCTAEVAWEVRPEEKRIDMGESFTPRAYELGCGGGKRAQLPARWESEDHAVVRIEPSGEIRGIGPGSATVWAVDPQGSGRIGSMRIIVER